MTDFSPGSLVSCREREWVVLPSESPDLLILRPLGGTESETTGIYLPLSRALGVDTVRPAQFKLPDPARCGDYISGRLLRDATRLTFRSGAGPFRSLGRISVRPRPFQLVPLLMALRLDPVRLLIADDVGIGKTIEAGLIARELLDRGEARRMVVVCPPHLCDQWQRELHDKFAINAVVVRSGTIAQLERALPPGDISVFEHYPALVVSIDFVKSDRRRYSFLKGCPELVIVDEVHTAARSNSRDAQQRHELLRELARDSARHLILLTATPHSGVEDAFRSLLELLDPAFGQLNLEQISENDRRRLARHLVQRRRADVSRWMGEETPFPIRTSREITYRLADSPEYRNLFDDVYSFARGLVRDESSGMTVWKRRVRYWAALALLRCVMSSPAAAEATLKARLARLNQELGEEDLSIFATYVFDFAEQETAQDFEPTPVVEQGEAQLGTSDRQRLHAFIRRAARLRGDADPKAAAAAREVAQLLRDQFHPIVYCRYIATADYLADELRRRLKKEFPDLHIISVTGASSEDEREQRVMELAASPCRVLVATDCLSEGINLQEAFDAVVHYDLPWNPNRLEQREGRVDRFGQPRAEVRATLLYGVDNPIDEAVLNVLLRKAISIHKTLGIMVPLPVNSESVVETVVRSLFQQGERATQLPLFASEPEVDLNAVHQDWDRAAAREQASRSRFAQHAIKPEEVAQELYESDLVLGSPTTVASFVRDACQRLGAPLTPAAPGARPGLWKLHLAALPAIVRERAGPAFMSRKTTEIPASVVIGFDSALPDGAHFVGRTHPLTEALAEYLLTSALEDSSANLPPASRCSIIRTSEVARRTTIILLRLRLLIETQDRPAPALAEELIVAGFEGHPGNLRWLEEARARSLLDETLPVGNIPEDQRVEQLSQAIAWFDELQPELNAIAEARASALRESHRRVRQTIRAGRVTVKPHLPLDLLGVYVLLPVPKGVAPPNRPGSD
ncbi:MAG: helicase [Herpetosiphonaceae bacterium]|nr:MAG: helicase [Herpetosiphonaceae bacterium]